MGTALIFPGQGSQYVGMGLSLFENSRAGRGVFSVAERVLGGKFLEVMFHGPGSSLAETRICQIALFVHSCAAVAVLEERGRDRQCAITYGLSLGELTALWAAGVFDFETGLEVVAERGRLMQAACEETDGAMLCLIGGEWGDIDSLCRDADVTLANINCPGQVVISGETRNIERATAIAEKMPFKRALRLNVAGAYHSKLMESAGVGFGKFLENVEFYPPKMQVLTNVTAKTVESPAEIKKMLAQQIVSPVLFEECCRRAMGNGVGEYLECGPGKTLSGMVKKIDRSAIARNFDRLEDFP
jgi:[acyl-carrier-protein] S-malonyltransferase